MSIQQMLLGASGASGYKMDRSLRFRASASAYLNRTPPADGNRTKWSVIFAVKRGVIGSGSTQTIFCAGTSSNERHMIRFSGDVIQHALIRAGVLIFDVNTTAAFRDPSAFYLIKIDYDTAQATASDRAKITVNNVQQVTTGTYPTLNYANGYINSTLPHNIGQETSNFYFDGYLAEFIFTDGINPANSAVYSTNALTGVTQPIPYTGSFGTQGAYLPFTDNSSVANLGTDFSGNGNTWTVNNISLTAGVTHDSMTDVPTLTNATAANFPVLNRILPAAGLPDIRDANLYLRCADASNFTAIPATMLLPKTGKWYAEFTAIYVDGTTSILDVGLLSSNDFPTPSGVIGESATSYSYRNTGSKINNSAATAYGASYVIGDVIAIAFDATAGTLTFYKNNVSQGVAFSGLSLEYFFAVGGYNFAQWQCNFGQRPFAYTPPTGFVALNTFNLPTSTILKGNTQMDATLYTGNGSTQTITNAGGFKPDLVWIKNRNNVRFNILTDSVRGTNSQMFSNDTSAQESRTDRLTAFNSNGFSVGSYIDVNNNADTFVGWQWKGGGAAVSNTAGSITSQVSANPSAGFSVVTYTGNATAGATVGHGLGVAPKLVIVKKRNGVQEWMVGSSSLTSWNNYLMLNTTAAQAGATTIWNDTAPTSSVFSLGSSTNTNGNTNTFVAYCFAEIDGYSKFGSISANGAADNFFAYTGFLPRFVMLKRTDSTSNWIIWDTARNTFNVLGNDLYPNLSNAEASTVSLDILSNGFKLRSSGFSGTWFYAAYATVPFKNSLGF